jgi:hypothetical protein
MGEKRRLRQDWHRIEYEYVHGIKMPNGEVHWPTFEELAVAHGTGPHTVGSHSAKGFWVQKRATFKKKLSERIAADTLAQRAKDIAALDKDTHAMSRGCLYLTGRRISPRIDLAQANDAARRIDPTVPFDEVIPLSHLDQIARVIGKLQVIAKESLGLPGSTTKVITPATELPYGEDALDQAIRALPEKDLRELARIAALLGTSSTEGGEGSSDSVP